MLSILACSCEPPKTEQKVFPHDAIVGEHNINTLIPEETYYNWEWIYRFELDHPRDSNNVSIFIYKDKEYYHPVQLAQRTLEFLNSLKITGNNEYLKWAEAHTKKLEEIGIIYDDALHFPYYFDYNLHGYVDQQMTAPWFSGMAQGEALSVFCRMYTITNNENYLATADQIFHSFLRVSDTVKPWVTFIDEAGYYWIEEYPISREYPAHVLNGFIFGIYGIYDYYSLTKNATALEVLKATLTTLKHYLGDYRVEKDISNYCLGHNHKSLVYHNVHIDQLRTLYQITDDIFFKESADNFYQDAH